MRPKPLLIALGLLFVAGASALALAPTLVARHLNQVAPAPPTPVTPSTLALHQTLAVADLHADSLLWSKNLLKRHAWGHVDVPRLQQGNVTLQTFSVVTKTPRGLNIHRNDALSDNIQILSIVQGWPVSTWNSLLQRALFQARKLHEFADASDGQLRVIANRKQLREYLVERASNPELTAGWLALEGAHALEGDLENLQKLSKAGYRMVAPTHFFDTELAGSAHGLKKTGLTALGRQWVAKMEESELIIDLAHASNATIDDVLKLATRPVIVSHTGLRATCDNDRNLSDAHLDAIASRGGLIGIGFWETAICGSSVQAIAQTIKYAVDRVGAKHVALGSDFDGAVTTPLDAARLPELTQALLNAGLSEPQVRLVMGQNVLDFLRQQLPES